MSVTLGKGRIVLHFPDGWHVVRWDARVGVDPAPYPYHDGIGKLLGALDGRTESTKAVDLVVSPPTPTLLLIELKDFRAQAGTGDKARALAFAGRWKDLPLEIALKVRDSLAGVHGLVQRGAPPALAAWMAPALRAETWVVAWIAQDAHRPNEPENKRKARDSELRNNLRRQLAWLTREARRVMVLDPLRDAMPRELAGIQCRATTDS